MEEKETVSCGMKEAEGSVPLCLPQAAVKPVSPVSLIFFSFKPCTKESSVIGPFSHENTAAVSSNYCPCFMNGLKLRKTQEHEFEQTQEDGRRGAWRAAVHGVTKGWTQLSN